MSFKLFQPRILVAASVCSIVMAAALPQTASAEGEGVNGAPSGTGQTAVGDPKLGAPTRYNSDGSVMNGGDVANTNGAPSGTGQAIVGDKKTGTVVHAYNSNGMYVIQGNAANTNGAPSGTGQATVGDPKN